MTVQDHSATELAAAWDRVADGIRKFGAVAAERGDTLDQAEGVRHTLRFLGHLADYNLEHTDPLRPYFWRATGQTRKFYGDGVDVDYDMARISGEHTYRITGTPGTVPYLAFIVYRKGTADRVAGNIVIGEEHLRADGTFEIWLGTDLGDRPGIALDPRTSEVVARQYHKDRVSEQSALFTIERVGPAAEPRSPLEPRRVIAALARIEQGLAVSLNRIEKLITVLRKEPNTVGELHGEEGSEFFGTTSNHYKMGWFSLDDAEHLELRFPAVQGRYFGVQLFNRWFESLEFRDHVTSLNDAQIVPEPNGELVVRIGADPTLVNRIDPCGHREGMIAVRYLEGAANPADPQARVVRS